MSQAAAIDTAFKAMADPTRRAVLERLSHGPAGASVLAKPFGMSLPSFMQHLRVLEEAGLVRSEKVGRVRNYELVPEGLELVGGWLDRQRRIWERRLDQLDEYLIEMKKEKK